MFLATIIAVVVATATPSPTPHPMASATPLKIIGTTHVVGRKQNLVGTATAASTGSIDQEEISTRPLLRPGELLEVIPGLVISQHSGGGKANQYYLRGFQLDHGTDLASTIDGIPVNLPTHAHGQGYSDINWLMPELVAYVGFEKGPYDAAHGDFSTAGSYDVHYVDRIEPTASFTAGTYGYERLFAATSHDIDNGNGALLYAVEYVHDNSTMDLPDNYRKFNSLVRYSVAHGRSDFHLTASAYNGTFSSTDQIPQRLVIDGELDRFGSLDPSDGGTTYRLALDAALNIRERNGALHVNAYGFNQFLDLYSNFTYYFFDANDYYNVTQNPITCKSVYTTCNPGALYAPNYTSYCPANNIAPAGDTAYHTIVPTPFSFSCGDQREQRDKRLVSGFEVSRDLTIGTSDITAASGMRNDNIAPVDLQLTNDRVEYPDGVLSDAHAVETDVFGYVKATIKRGPKLRIFPGIRADVYHFTIDDQAAANSGQANAALISPKLSAAYAFSKSQELYANFGDSFHSNDGRGITQTVDPQTHATFDPTGAPVEQVTPLVRAVGEELGYRFSTHQLNTTLSLWQLNLASELIFDGDHGVTYAGGPTVRRGLELANFFSPTQHVTVDADLATSTARFTDDPGDLGTYVPESLNEVISSGITFDEPHYAASLRMRYFGPRVLTQDGAYVSPPSTIFNAQLTAKLQHGYRVSFDALNMFNAQAADVTYYYASWLPQDAANPANANNPAINPAFGGQGINDYHFHPSEARVFRVTLSVQ